MVDCSCYHDEINFIGKRGACWGTKEMEPCSCGGDAAKCDFYDYVRERAKKPLTNYDLLIRKTPEELAAWIDGSFRHADWCDTSKFPNGDCMEVPCLGCIIDWLKQEVNDGRN